MATRFWSKRSIRPHEELAQKVLMMLAMHMGDDAREQAMPQYPVRNIARRMDLYIPGRYLRDAVPPPLYPQLQHRDVLVEFESGALTLHRARQMMVAHVGANAQLHARWKRLRAGGAQYQETRLLIYANGIRADVLKEFRPTDVGCVFHATYMGLSSFSLDIRRVPSETSYNHIRLLYVPDAKTEEELAQKIEERLLSAHVYSYLKNLQLQDLAMEYLHKTIENHDRRDRVLETTIHGALRQGKNEGLVTAIHTIAQARGVTLSPQSLRRLEACDDVEQLKAWLSYVGTTEDETVEF